MPYPMSHIYIAKTILPYIYISKESQYYLGIIIPNATDSIERDTHLNNRIDKSDMGYYIKKWESNVIEFYNKYITKYNFDFLSGYCIHLMSDIYYKKNVTIPYVQYHKKNKTQNAILKYSLENNKVDYEIFSNYNYERELFIIKENSIKFNFKNIVFRNEMNEIIDNYINIRYCNNYNYKNIVNEYITYDLIMDNNSKTIEYIKEEFIKYVINGECKTCT